MKKQRKLFWIIPTITISILSVFYLYNLITDPIIDNLHIDKVLTLNSEHLGETRILNQFEVFDNGRIQLLDRSENSLKILDTSLNIEDEILISINSNEILSVYLYEDLILMNTVIFDENLDVTESKLILINPPNMKEILDDKDLGNSSFLYSIEDPYLIGDNGIQLIKITDDNKIEYIDIEIDTERVSFFSNGIIQRENVNKLELEEKFLYLRSNEVVKEDITDCYLRNLILEESDEYSNSLCGEYYVTLFQNSSLSLIGQDSIQVRGKYNSFTYDISKTVVEQNLFFDKNMTKINDNKTLVVTKKDDIYELVLIKPSIKKFSWDYLRF